MAWSICAVTVAIAAPSIPLSPIAFMRIGSNIMFIKAPVPIIIMASFINPSPRITILEACVKLTKNEPMKIIFIYLTARACMSGVAPIIESNWSVNTSPSTVTMADNKTTQNKRLFIILSIVC